jgi:adenylosuccinate lyase
MVVHADRMRENIDLTYGALFSQRVLLALVAGGLQRDDAYRIAQRTAQQAWDTKTQLRSILEADAEPAVQALDLDEIFDLSHYTKHAHEIVGRLDLLAEATPVGAATA